MLCHLDGNSKEETERKKNTYFLTMRTNLPKCDLNSEAKKQKIDILQHIGLFSISMNKQKSKCKQRYRSNKWVKNCTSYHREGKYP